MPHWVYWGNCQQTGGVVLRGLSISATWLKEEVEKFLDSSLYQVGSKYHWDATLKWCFLSRAITALVREPFTMGNFLEGLIWREVKKFVRRTIFLPDLSPSPNSTFFYTIDCTMSCVTKLSFKGLVTTKTTQNKNYYVLGLVGCAALVCGVLVKLWINMNI